MSTDLDLALQMFKDEHEYRGSNKATVDFYFANIERFRLSRGVDDLQQWNLQNLMAYFVDKRQDCSPATVLTYHRALKTVSRWLHRRGYLEEDLFSKLPAPKKPQGKPEPFTAADIENLIKVVKSRAFHRRNIAIIMLLLDTGIRAGELCSLKLNSINWREQSITVTGKTGTRTVPVSGKTLTAIKRYIDNARKTPDPNERHLFLSKTGRPVSATGVGQMIRNVCLAAGITDKKTGPHTFRHTFAFMYLEAGAM